MDDLIMFVELSQAQEDESTVELDIFITEVFGLEELCF